VSPRRSRARALTVVGAVLPGLALACSYLAPALQPSPKSEAELGERVRQKLAAEPGLYVDPHLASMLNGLATRLTKAAPTPPPTPIQFHVVDDGVPRLFSTLGGHVYVSRGFLATLGTEDELANALGHEAAHVLLGHAAELRGESRAAGAFALLGVVAAAAGPLPVAPAVGLVGANASQQAVPVDADVPIYSASQELAADALAQEICARAGFDPAVLLQVFRTSLRLGWGEVSDERVEEASRRTATLGFHPNPQRVLAAQEAYLAALDGLPLQEAPTTELLSGSLWIDRRLGLTLQLPKAWQVVQGPRTLVVTNRQIDALQGICIRVDPYARPHDPVVAATQYAREHGFEESAPAAVPGRNAHRAYGWSPFGVRFQDDLSGCAAAAHAVTGQAAADLTWIAWPPGVLRIAVVASFATTGETDLPEAEKRTLRSVAESAKPVEAGDYAGANFLRLRIVRPEPGEKLRDVVARTPTPWSVAEAAAVNDLPADLQLSANTRVRLAWSEPYAQP